MEEATSTPTYQGSSPRIRGELRRPRHGGTSSGIIPANTGRINVAFFYATDDTDHPREYGENRSGFGDKVEPDGSSPRIRGESARLPHRCIQLGIIPANTGRIASAGGIPPPVRDHPREYGENMKPRVNWQTILGSSPRIRGEFLRFFYWCLAARIIPANTGRMVIVCGLGVHWWDHPREYGENWCQFPLCL